MHNKYETDSKSDCVYNFPFEWATKCMFFFLFFLFVCLFFNFLLKTIKLNNWYFSIKKWDGDDGISKCIVFYPSYSIFISLAIFFNLL